MKKELHLSLEEDVKIWLENESKRQDKYIGQLITEIAEFYKVNKTLPEKYKNAELYITDIIKKVIAEEKKKEQENTVGFIRPGYARS